VAPPSQTIIAYAADLDELASGGYNRNGVYTQELLKAIAPGIRIEDVFKEVREEVESLSQGQQKPTYLPGLTGDPVDFAGKPAKGVVIVRTGPGAKDPRRRPGEEFRDCPECPSLVAIPVDGARLAAIGGSGASALRPYAIGKHEVTIGEWNRCAAEIADCRPQPGADNEPVVKVNWSDAKAYANWLSNKTGKTYRLPFAGEWEHAVRGGASSRFAWGDDIGAGNAACVGCGSSFDGRGPAPVQQFKPNGYGLYDMHGNIWEWAEDCPAEGESTGVCHKSALCGGSYKSPAKNLTRCVTSNASANTRHEDFGFRVARSLNY
jgi:hypothetical protein